LLLTSILCFDTAVANLRTKTIVRQLERTRFTEPLQIRFTEKDLERLRELAEEIGVSIAGLIRWACRDLLERASNNPNSLYKSAEE
jgi:beta-glucosidase/6-phospho-beta-glucosidase/beta-galactosidase